MYSHLRYNVDFNLNNVNLNDFNLNIVADVNFNILSKFHAFTWYVS